MDLVEAGSRSLTAFVRHPWERARVKLVSRLIAPVLNPGDTVVDIGCGDAFVVQQLAAAYPSAQFYGVDHAFTPELLERYRARLTVPNVALFSSLRSVPLQQAPAVVLLMDVLEHVADDLAFLEQVAERCVDERTRIVMTVPSYSVLFSSHDRFLRHHRRYSRSSLRRLLRSGRLVEIRSGYWFTSLLAARAVQVARERLTGVTKPPPNLAKWRGGEGAARAVSAILLIDGWLSMSLARVGIVLPGLSNFAVCRKSA